MKQRPNESYYDYLDRRDRRDRNIALCLLFVIGSCALAHFALLIICAWPK